MKKITSYALLAILVLAVLMVGTIEHQDIEIQSANAICENQTVYTTPTHDQCVANQLERNNDR